MALPARRLVAAAALLAAVAAALPPAPADAAEPGVVPDLTWYVSDAEQERTAAAIADAGARWVRLHVQWRDVERFPGVHDIAMLAHVDRAVALSTVAGARVLLMVYAAPEWASGSAQRTTPLNVADYGRFVEFLASRYRGRVAAYELWNEPNVLRFWSTGRDPAAYVSLLKAGYAGVKAADPVARVVFGAVSFSDWRFVEEAYAAGAKGWFDVMGTHPYTYCGTRPPDVVRNWDGKITEGSFVAYRNVRATMLAHGDDKPIWLTEFGWNTSTQTCDLAAKVYGGVSEETQAAYLAKAFELLEGDPYVEVAFVYNFRNNYWSRDADVHHARYGLLRSDFSPKPSYAVFKAYATRARAAAPDAAPTVRVTARAAGRNALTVEADASDDGGVARVEFALDGRPVGTATARPYRVTVARGALPPGRHRVTATAYDDAGRSATAAVVVRLRR